MHPFMFRAKISCKASSPYTGMDEHACDRNQMDLRLDGFLTYLVMHIQAISYHACMILILLEVPPAHDQAGPKVAGSTDALHACLLF